MVLEWTKNQNYGNGQVNQLIPEPGRHTEEGQIDTVGPAIWI